MRMILLGVLVLAASCFSTAAETAPQAPQEIAAGQLAAEFDAKLARNAPVAAAIGEMAARHQALRAVTIELMQRPMSDAPRRVFLTATERKHSSVFAGGLNLYPV